VTVTGGLTLNGTAKLGETDYSQYSGVLYFQGTQTLSGSGGVVFGSNSSNEVRESSSNASLTFGPGITVHGKNGKIDGTSTGTFVNEGTISADTAGGTITLSATGWSNQGTITAQGGAISITGGGLTLNGSAFLASQASVAITVNGT
jgi:hypothetical protein